MSRYQLLPTSTPTHSRSNSIDASYISPGSRKRIFLKALAATFACSTAVLGIYSLYDSTLADHPSAYTAIPAYYYPHDLGDVRSLTALQSATNLSTSDILTSYKLFLPSPQIPSSPLSSSNPSLTTATLPVPILDDDRLDSWIGEGKSCGDGRDSFGKEIELDAVWTWVNGSDPLWHQNYHHYLSEATMSSGLGSPPLKHYRNKDELRHSLRSVLSNLEGKIRKFHIVLGDWALEPADITFARTLPHLSHLSDSEARFLRLGQIPSWLDQELLGIRHEHSGLTIEVHHHSEIWIDRTLTETEMAGEKGDAYRKGALPTFNSFAIEGQLVNVPDLAPHWIYLNDDFFLTQPHSISDWVSPVFGPVLRLSNPHGVVVPYHVEFPATACPHEWSALERSNWLLAKRFGNRQRVGLEHIAKVQSTAMLQEVAQIWKEDFKHSSARRFREQDRVAGDPGSRVGDIHATWLGAILQTERHREALLYTWAMIRLPSLSPSSAIPTTWGPEARREIYRLLSVSSEAAESKKIVIASVSKREDGMERDTLHGVLEKGMGGGVLETAGFSSMDAAKLDFSSLDGPLPEAGNYERSCDIRMDRCFGSWWNGAVEETVDASDMFKRIAFEYSSACGDCILSALMRDSGSRGLSSILPSTSLTFSSRLPAGISQADFLPPQPHLPLTKKWGDTDFSLANVVGSVGDVDLRKWALQLIARYQYSLGSQSYEFAQIHYAADLASVEKAVAPGSSVTALVINDDIEGTDEQQDQAAWGLTDFLERTWPTPAWYERLEEHMWVGEREKQ